MSSFRAALTHRRHDLAHYGALFHAVDLLTHLQARLKEVCGRGATDAVLNMGGKGTGRTRDRDALSAAVAPI
jgi:hypothetical protein